MGERTCTVDGCNRAFYARQFCGLHYRRWRTRGEVGSALPERIYGDPHKVITARVEVSATGCWEWLGARNSGGYGSARYRGRHIGAHRLVYLTIVGEIPVGLELDHLCRNRGCVNPKHLEPVTTAENVRRAGLANRRATCGRGHSMSGENLRITPTGGQRCKQCERDWAREWQRKKRAKQRR